ncbi:hypothetical protein CRG98_015236, partial [Punica granatum]
ALNPTVDQLSTEEGWVVCRVFRKKNFQKTLDHSPKSSSSTSMDSKLIHNLSTTNNLNINNIKDNPSSVLDQILLYMGERNSACKIETSQPRMPVTLDPSDYCDTVSSIKLIHQPLPDLHERFMHLPRLECPATLPSIFPTPPLDQHNVHQPFDELTDHNQDQSTQSLTVGDWAAFDRLVASQLNGQAETPSDSAFGLQLANEEEEEEEEEDANEGQVPSIPRFRISRPHHQNLQPYNGNENADLWSFTKSSSPQPSDPLRHLSV